MKTVKIIRPHGTLPRYYRAPIEDRLTRRGKAITVCRCAGGEYPRPRAGVAKDWMQYPASILGEAEVKGLQWWSAIY